MTALVRTGCSKAAGPVEAIDTATASVLAAMKLSEVYRVAQGGELLLLLSHADAGQAVALLSALAKAAQGLLSSTADSWTDGPSACVVMLLVVHVSSTYSSLVSGLFPPDEIKRGCYTWEWPRTGEGGSPAAEAEAVAAPYRQMLRLASFVLHTWTPVFARMHDATVRPHVQHEGRQPLDALLGNHDLAASMKRFLKGHLERCARLPRRVAAGGRAGGGQLAAAAAAQLVRSAVGGGGGGGGVGGRGLVGGGCGAAAGRWAAGVCGGCGRGEGAAAAGEGGQGAG